MTAQFFTAWEAETKSITQLIANSDLADDTEVWRGADGSYAIGQPQDIFDELGDENEDILELYQEAGTVGEYRN